MGGRWGEVSRPSAGIKIGLGRAIIWALRAAGGALHLPPPAAPRVHRALQSLAFTMPSPPAGAPPPACHVVLATFSLGGISIDRSVDRSTWALTMIHWLGPHPSHRSRPRSQT